MTKLAAIRGDASREYFPVYISNAGRSHTDAERAASGVSDAWDVEVEYVPDHDKQGRFYLNAEDLSDLEIEAIHMLIDKRLRRYPQVYDLANPRE